MTPERSMLDAALNYTSKGWRVFPCRANKKPLIQNGFKAASTDPEQVRKWWMQWPTASVGCPMGAEHGAWVLDVDLPKGPESLAALEAEHGPLPATVEQHTGGSGRQLFFKWIKGREVRNSANKLAPSLDVRGEGGYVILPPSGHLSGGTYSWVSSGAALAEAPAWLLDMVAPLSTAAQAAKTAPLTAGGTTPYGRKALEAEAAIVMNTAQGGRNQALNESAFALGQLVAGGELDRQKAEATLLDAALAVGLTEIEARKTIASGMAAGEREPRRAPEQLASAAKPVARAIQSTPSIDEEWTPEATKWPTLPLAAMPGFVGDFIQLATRNSEADPAAVLATFLTRFGVELISPHILIGETTHKARLFAAICGASSKARKGTSAAPVKKLFTFGESSGHIPAQYSPGPLSTGEGLVYAVRDELKEWKVDRQNPTGAWVVTDPGVSDKRLFVLDEELAAALNCTNRQGNTLSTAMRCFWDNGNLNPLTKSNRTRTTGAHLALVTHITVAELTSLLDAVQSLNGFANRFLWVYAKRRGVVPFPEPMPDVELDAIRRELLTLLHKGKHTERVLMDSTAREMWKYVYLDLSQEHPGLAGCVINRGEAQVMRLALIYTLLAGQNIITAEHLGAALAFWQYCHESAMLIFGGRETDPMVDKVLAMLRGGAKSLTEIHKALGNHDTKRVKDVLGELSNSGRVRFTSEQTGGRSKTVFSLCENRELCELCPPTHRLPTLIRIIRLIRKV
ncbi:Protein of unknown function [Humidesulfovibrio mexicanus]|uniref:DNA primase/polymerase bifunctional N-terminal domain-containing protein n=1 Tax=Humidesulfovibrio mexicanus TaxID=147047 RepID=A0A239B5M1_9BACT|nr:bifunctional DNA primase/polymerase [Humidesulfovibrio mexicanus]SNS03190.1 Protein of unknown function [Humidesulfovibrio mexicanus]